MKFSPFSYYFRPSEFRSSRQQIVLETSGRCKVDKANNTYCRESKLSTYGVWRAFEGSLVVSRDRLCSQAIIFSTKRQESVYDAQPQFLMWLIVIFSEKLISNFKNDVFWDMALCRSYVNRRFGGTCIYTSSTLRHIPEDGILHSHRCESLKSYNF
jgi:hypothetical protein